MSTAGQKDIMMSDPGAYQEVVNNIIEVLHIYGPLEIGEINKKVVFVSSVVIKCVNDLYKRGILVREKVGMKPFSESVMLRNVYKYRLRTIEVK